LRIDINSIKMITGPQSPKLLDPSRGAPSSSVDPLEPHAHTSINSSAKRTKQTARELGRRDVVILIG
jgi:hypothetical protein